MPYRRERGNSGAELLPLAPAEMAFVETGFSTAAARGMSARRQLPVSRFARWPAAVSPRRVKSVMAEDAAELLTHALKLPPAARAALADSLIDSLDQEVDENAEEAWRSEIALRVRDLDSGAVQTIAWDEVHRQLRTKLNG